MDIRLARKDELGKIKRFYDDIIDTMESSQYGPRWKKDIYPDERYIADSIEKGELYVAADEGCFAGAFVINNQWNEGYDKIKWQVSGPREKISVIHILGVSPLYHRRGIGEYLVQKAVEISEAMGKKALRLDVIEGNLPAAKLYVKMGFSYRDTVSMFYEESGWQRFRIYEFPLNVT
ncbi:MAG TPA: GNAT family N-acetyltransferase [Candidatus Copromorpha excrementigallinarum]|uniref:GNAT family N-acetyltransferase n=1 Tax=Candidatus Allocopromorpha excrementigallinarum TaxID=2840742 RepID=A0A9D1I2F4_9FIRM|nr:GNAT family N-acetyltransferase [Candidatus Copromorpha excrementigallinarum]